MVSAPAGPLTRTRPRSAAPPSPAPRPRHTALTPIRAAAERGRL
jgi:hypothetical protein